MMMQFFLIEQPVSLKVALRQRLRWSKGHLQAFAESGWGLFKNIFVDKNTKHKPTDKWYNYPWRTFRHRFMSFDTFGQLLPKNVVACAKWIIWKLILGPASIYALGGQMVAFDNGTYLSKIVSYFAGDGFIEFSSGWKAYGLCLLATIWIRLFYRIGKYFVNIWVAVYLFIIEHKRMPKFSLWKKVLYCLARLADFRYYWKMDAICSNFQKKVEWKPIPHNSKITIDDIEENKLK